MHLRSNYKLCPTKAVVLMLVFAGNAQAKAEEAGEVLVDPAQTSERDTLRSPCAGDDRIKLPRDSRLGIGRIYANSICTAFILSNGAVVTAAYCVDIEGDGIPDSRFLNATLDFNLSDSTWDGCFRVDEFTRSYPIEAVLDSQYAPAGDWAVFTVGPDDQGNEAALVEGFLRPDNDGPIPHSLVRVTGYGRDIVPPTATLCGGNSDSFTLQTDAAFYENFESNQIGYRIDTAAGNYGSPIIQEGTDRVIGVHNADTCVDVFTPHGIAFTKRTLADAVNSFQGPSAVHLDAAAASGGDGSIFDPYRSLNDAVNATPAGGTLVIVTGSYSGAVTIDKELEIVTPVGGATLGS